MQKQVELADLETIIDALKQARDPMVRFSLDSEKMTTRAIVMMQAGIDQALKCLERICQEANHDKS